VGLSLERVEQLDDVPVVHKFLQNLNFLDNFALALSLRVEVFLGHGLDCDKVACQDVLR
jgi:hypothetical protein